MDSKAGNLNSKWAIKMKELEKDGWFNDCPPGLNSGFCPVTGDTIWSLWSVLTKADGTEWPVEMSLNETTGEITFGDFNEY